MAKKWSGAGTNKLPSQQIEPYRLWFEFLQLASQDTSIRVNKKFYLAWENYASLSFDNWWRDNWQKLFSIDVGVYEISNFSKFKQNDNDSLIIRVPLYQNPKITLKQINDILLTKGASNRLKDMRSGQFHISVGKSPSGKAISPATRFLKNIAKIRLLLNLYGFWIKNEGLPKNLRLDKTSIDYFNWAATWNKKIKDKGWDRRPIEIPYAITGYVNYLKNRGKRLRLPKAMDGGAVDVLHINYRRQIDRYLTKAQSIAQNVGRGEFPGQY